MPPSADTPTLADIQRQYPHWKLWRAISGRYYARPQDAAPIHADDLSDLRDQISHTEAGGDQDQQQS